MIRHVHNATPRVASTLICLACSTALAVAQDEAMSVMPENYLNVTGSVMSDILIPQDDEKIGATKTDDWALTNTYADVNLMSKRVDAGFRFSFLEHPLPGYEAAFKGWGVPYYYAKLHFDKWDLTGGHFYDQFGSGFIFRTYEERSLGVDNPLLGGRLTAKPLPGVSIKVLSGRQRRYWSLNRGLVSGADVEFGLEEWISSLGEGGGVLNIGFSWVNKYEKEDVVMADATHRLHMPEFVNAFDVRANFHRGPLGILAEYAWKGEDPSADNGYIYRRGTVGMISATYSQSGMSILLQAKRSDYMSFRSRRGQTGTSSFINHLPAFSMDHTYALAALYPYATHPDGEWAFQLEAGYNFRCGTALGGKYGTNLKLNASHIRSLDRDETAAAIGSNGHGSAFWKMGDTKYYQDINIQLSKRLSKVVTLNAMYMNQYYNKTVVEGHGGMIHSNIFVVDAKMRATKKLTVRAELQYLATADDEGDWAQALVEVSLLPHWMFTVSDMYNAGETDLHYYNGAVTFNTGAHRIQAGYGRTRAGYNCSGGVCRYVPASRGVSISYNYNF